MKYRNIKTGAMIETRSEIIGGDWQEIPAVAVSPSQKEIQKSQAKPNSSPTKQATRKKG